MRWKLAAAMSVPTVALSGFVLFETADLADDVAAVRSETELATAADGPTGLLIALQNERNWATSDLVGQGGLVPSDATGYEETRAATDEALEGFQETLERSQDEVVHAYRPAVEGLATALRALRQQVDSYEGARNPVDGAEIADSAFEAYRGLIAPFLDGTTLVADAVGHAELARGAGLIDASLRLVEALADMSRSTILYAVLSEGGVNTPEEVNDVAEKHTLFQRYVDRIEEDTAGIYRPADDEWLFGEWTPAIDDLITTALRTSAVDINHYFDLLDQATERQTTYIDYCNEVASILQDKASDLNDEAVSRRQTYLAAVAVVWILAVAGMLLVGQVIIRALHALVRQANDVAHRRLPAAVGSVQDTPRGEDVIVPEVIPIDVKTRDEIGDVAAALNTVQQSALGLAVGQAVTRRNIADALVSLGRRNQNLLNRQISFITELEQHEADPDNLANLFHLDHLAARMRRNAESLVVLADAQAPRSQRPVAPARMVDVIRATVGEVEQYQRVDAYNIEPVQVSGHAVADLMHLLAELVDNALAFSPVQEKVEVRGQCIPTGYALWVVDQGSGMSSDQVAQANRRLAGTETFTVAPSTYLGHYVAGRLAARHGIQVQLQGIQGVGVTATVQVPHHVLSPAPTSDPSATPIAGPPTPATPAQALG
jgi:signal transduction histidine kinase